MVEGVAHPHNCNAPSNYSADRHTCVGDITLLARSLTTTSILEKHAGSLTRRTPP